MRQPGPAATAGQLTHPVQDVLQRGGAACWAHSCNRPACSSSVMSCNARSMRSSSWRSSWRASRCRSVEKSLSKGCRCRCPAKCRRIRGRRVVSRPIARSAVPFSTAASVACRSARCSRRTCGWRAASHSAYGPFEHGQDLLVQFRDVAWQAFAAAAGEHRLATAERAGCHQAGAGWLQVVANHQYQIRFASADGSHRCAGAGMLVLLELQLRTPCNQIGVAMGQAWQRRAASECSGYRVQRRRGRHPDFAPRPPFK